MCGRYTLTSKELTELEEFLKTTERDSTFSDPKAPYSNYNVAPTHEMLVAYVDDNGKRTMGTMHWGFMGWKPKPGGHCRSTKSGEWAGEDMSISWLKATKPLET